MRIIRVDSQHGEISAPHDESTPKDEYHERVRHNRLFRRVMNATGADLLGRAPPVPSRISGRIAIALDDVDSTHSLCYLSPEPVRSMDRITAAEWRWPPHPVDMLQELQDNPESVVDRMRSAIEREPRESSILSDWLDSPKTPVDSLSRESWVGPVCPQTQYPQGCGPMRMDGFRHQQNETASVVEVKTNWTASAIQSAIGQAVVGRQLSDQFEAGATDTSAHVVFGDGDWTPETGWPGGSNAVVRAAAEVGIELWLRDSTDQWQRLASYL
jgi:hypothetical protein